VESIQIVYTCLWLAVYLSGFLPLCDALVRPDDGGLDVDGVITHPSQLHGFLQSTDHIQGIVTLCNFPENRDYFPPVVKDLVE